MHLNHLSLMNFRNFVRLETDFAEGPTVLVGANAQGKTSLLEAIHYLTSATSPHTTSDRQLINFLALDEAAPFSRIVAEFSRRVPTSTSDQPRLQRIEIRIILESSGTQGDLRLRKEVLLNGVKRRVRDLSSFFTAVMFLPQDMRVIEGPPKERRQFLNHALYQANPAYATALTEYGNVLNQRNALLKQLQERNGDPDELEFWDESLCSLAAILIRQRILGLRSLEEYATSIHQELTRRKETLRIDYLPSYDPLAQPAGQLDLPMETSIDRSGIGQETIHTGMLTALERSRREELQRGVTLIGPHRDDIRFRSEGIDLRLYGSRGQNRTALMSMQLAQVDWLLQQTGERPVLLLDEVLAELDPERRADLLEHVMDAQQAILTAADLEMFTEGFCEKAQIWSISAGTISTSPDA
jgi:DNA replication and repair protein RecF